MSTATTTQSSDAPDTPYTPVAETIGAVLATGERPPRPSALSASLTFGWRAMLKIKHVPEQLFDVTAFPLILTLIFTYLFGGAIAGSTGEYLQFLLPGILVMSVLLMTMYTGTSVNNDFEKGVADRFRTLPIWRPSSLVGSLFGDMFRYILASITIVIIGLILGFRPSGGFSGVLAGVLLLIAFSFSVSWIWTMFGLMLRSDKAVIGVSNMVLFPLTFLSNVFVDTTTMPGWLQAFVKINPITHLVSAERSLMSGNADGGEITWVLISCVVIIAIFGGLTMRQYNRK